MLCKSGSMAIGAWDLVIYEKGYTGFRGEFKSMFRNNDEINSISCPTGS